MLGALITVARPGWVLSRPGLVAFAAWNALLLAMALLMVSRLPGVCAHGLEEQQREAPMRVIDPTSHRYDGPAERGLTERRQ